MSKSVHDCVATLTLCQPARDRHVTREPVLPVMSQASQRVSKLSRRAGRGSRPPPASVPELPDLDTSDDFTSSLSFGRYAFLRAARLIFAL